jgi:uncharacterized protein (TIGR02246 family)
VSRGRPARRLILALIVGPVALGCTRTTAPPFTSADAAAVEELERAYVDAWTRNDSAAVLATLAPDAVLLPSRNEPRVGLDSVRSFWFPPDAPPTIVTAYDTRIEEIDGVGDLAYVRGRGDLSFEWTDGGGQLQQRRSQSTFLMIARRGPDGRWKIARRMWSDLP